MPQLRLLLVEDHRDIAANIADYFGALGHSVELAGDGAEGLQLAESGSHDVVLLDLMLPQLDGLELCRRLRGAGCDVPVLMLTALDALPDKVAGFEAGADDYLAKPFALAELKLRVEALTRRHRAAPSPRVLRVGELSYDPGALHASRGGVPIVLNPTTRRLLELLMRQTHRVVSRAELMRGLWGEGADDDEALRAHMHALRQAVDKPFARPLLHTVHRVGYRLADLGTAPDPAAHEP
jgi:DNA-binding response OmpR family regulator